MGVFTLVIGLAIFGYKHTLTIDKKQLKTTIGIYQLIFKTKHMNMMEFSSIHLGAGSITSGDGHVSSAPFILSFSYKNPDNYMSGDSYEPKRFGLNPFTKFNLRKWNPKNFDDLSNNLMKDISELTRLPIKSLGVLFPAPWGVMFL